MKSGKFAIEKIKQAYDVIEEVKDSGELGTWPDGRERLLHALKETLRKTF